MDQRRAALNRWLAPIPVAFVGLFFAWPVLTVLARALRWEAVGRIATNDGIRAVAWFTVWQATLSTLLTIVIALPATYVVARFDFRGRHLLVALVTAPFVLPTVVVAAAFTALAPGVFPRSVLGILAAHVFFNVAVVVRTVGVLWEQIDPGLVDAARTLGAGHLQAARFVTAPLLRPALTAAGSIVMLFTLTSYGVVRILGGPGRSTLEVEIYQRAAQLGDLPGAAVLSLVQLIAIVVALAWVRRLSTDAPAVGRRDTRDRRVPATRRDRAVVIAVSTLTGLAVLAPLTALVTRSFRVGHRWSLSGWRSLGTSEVRPGVRLGALPWEAITTSLRTALAATVIALVMGTLAALVVAAPGRTGRWLDLAVMLPLGTSAVTVGFGILITFDRSPVDWRAEPWLIPVVHALVATPFVVRSLVPVLRAVPDDVRAAAATLGASPRQVLVHVDLPIGRRALAGAAAFAFAISMGEFGATSFLTRTGTETLPIAIARLLGRTGDVLQTRAYVLSTILAVITTAAGMLISTDLGGGRRAGRP